jgi:2-oxoglutarate dehydrogenase E2 component (dihydrolipoamide succinyltransferase)
MADVVMPQLGETVTTGTIVKWCKSVGQHVGEDEPLFEVSTDKIDTEIPSHLEGILVAILVPEGETVAIGTVIAQISGDHEPFGQPTPPFDEPFEAESTADHVDDHRESNDTTDTDAHNIITPVVSRIAAERGVLLSAVKGTGAGGRITKADVLSAPAASHVPTAIAPSSSPTASTPPADFAAPSPKPPVLTQDGDERVVLSRARTRAANNLRESVDTAVHTLVVMQADYTKVWQLREALKADFKATEGFSLTFLPFVGRAVCDALGSYRQINATLDLVSPTDASLVVRKHVNLGVAIDLANEGLIVPVVQRAEELRLRGLARAINDLATRARAKHLGLDDFVGGSFTLTNAGSYGTLHTAPIMQPGQVAILGTDAVEHRPVAVQLSPGNWGLAAKPVGNLSFSFDHRAFDGVYASRYLREVCDRIADHDWSTEL